MAESRLLRSHFDDVLDSEKTTAPAPAIPSRAGLVLALDMSPQ